MSLKFGERTLVMGVVNLTPDSFSGDGRLRLGSNPAAHARFAAKLVRDGADIIDLGGESTRPGAVPVSAKQELKRVIPVLRLLVRRSATPVSVDTYKPLVAQAALDEGAAIINNIMGTKPDKRLLKMVRDHNAYIVLMHMRGTPRTMQTRTHYRDVAADIIKELRISIRICLDIGIKKDKIVIDPGIGFAKTPTQNLEILNRLDEFKVLRRPILVGTSRKSFIGAVLGNKEKQRLWGTAATVAMAVARGADIVRVHDVGVMQDVVTMTDAIVRSNRSKQ